VELVSTFLRPFYPALFDFNLDINGVVMTYRNKNINSSSKSSSKTSNKSDEKALLYINSKMSYVGKSAFAYKNIDLLIDKIMDKIFIEKKHPIVCFDKRSQLDITYYLIIELAKTRGYDPKYFIDNCLRYTKNEGDTSDYHDVDNAWKNKIVMYSPKVIYGIDFHPPESEPVFLISVQPTCFITLNAF